MNGNASDQTTDNIIDIFSGKPLGAIDPKRVVRLAPENDGLCMLYSNQANPDKLYSMNLLCWALRQDGDIVGMVPWLNTLSPCVDLRDPLNGRWEGYYDPLLDEIFYEPPMHKIVELETAAEYFDSHEQMYDDEVLQEIVDNIGTHAMLANDDFNSLTLTEVLSWRLHNDGRISAMLIDQDKITSTPGATRR